MDGVVIGGMIYRVDIDISRVDALLKEEDEKKYPVC